MARRPAAPGAVAAGGWGPGAGAGQARRPGSDPMCHAGGARWRCRLCQLEVRNAASNILVAMLAGLVIAAAVCTQVILANRARARRAGDDPGERDERGQYGTLGGLRWRALTGQAPGPPGPRRPRARPETGRPETRRTDAGQTDAGQPEMSQPEPGPTDTVRAADVAEVVAPDGSRLRPLARVPGGSVSRFELGAGEVSRAVAHRSVDEIWYVLEGRGEMWRRHDGAEETVQLEPGTCLSITAGTGFQFRASADGPLAVVAVTMPPWPGPDEAREVDGAWPPRSS